MFLSFFTDKVRVNEATIIESEVFVYNLGTMFYIDKVLFTNRNSLPATTNSEELTTTVVPTTENTFTTADEAEAVPIEVEAAMPDILVADEEAATTITTTAIRNVTVK